MSGSHPNNFPKLHNAAWPGVVGKGDGAEPVIDLDTMLDLTAAAEVDGVKFDGVDLFLFAPHVDIDATDDDLKALADKVTVARPGDRLGRRPGLAADRRRLGDGRGGGPHASSSSRSARAAASPKRLRELGVRPYGVVRIDSACGPGDWAQDPEGNQAKIAETFRQAGDDRRGRTASGWPPRARSAGAACTPGGRWSSCWSGSASPRRVGFQADMAHTLLYTLGDNAPEDRILPEDFDWNDPAALDEALEDADRRAAALDDRLPRRPERRHRQRLRLARQDRPALPGRPTPTASSTSRTTPASGCATRTGSLTKTFQHICWDGCMFPNEVMMKPQTWNDILAAMIAVRDAHGWAE